MKWKMSSSSKFIFIDRDGVINKDPGGWTEYSYVTTWSQFRFLPGSLQALRILNENGFKVMIISNQAGVSKGYFSKADLDNVTKKMLEEIIKKGGLVKEVYYCVHKDADKCDCRKPKTGSFEEAANKYNIDLKTTYFVGDSQVDVDAGTKAGCETILVLSGKTDRGEIALWAKQPGHIFDNLLAAVKWIVKKEEKRA